MTLPELLAPAGDQASFHAALANGADAVYIGIGRFNMRRSQDGCLHFNQIAGMVKEAHEKGAKLYVTLNTIVYQEELPELDRTIAVLKEAAVDAVIACDWAVIRRAKAAGIPVHISTQMSASNAEVVRFLAEQGADGIISTKTQLIRQAKDLLSSDYGSISQVAKSVGFASVYHFSKMFKAYSGMNFSDYLSAT